MPATFAHYTFGKRVFKKEKKDVKQIIKDNLQLYWIGLHGPDILFYYKPYKTNKVSSFGYNMHDLPARGFFERAAEIYKDAGLAGDTKTQEKMKAYLLGFVCHYALDCCCHGYIENKIHVSDVTHIEIEGEFDRRLMLDQGIDPMTNVLTRHIRPTMANAKIIEPFFEGITSEEVCDALKGMKLSDRFFLSKNKAKQKFLMTGLKVTRHDSLKGLVMHEDANVKCIDSDMRLKKLMDKAEKLALELIDNYIDVLDGDGVLSDGFNLTFGAGDNWRAIPVLPVEEEVRYEV